MQWLGTESKTNWRLLIPYSGTLGRRSRESSTILRALYDFYYGTLRLYFLLYLYFVIWITLHLNASGHTCHT